MNWLNNEGEDALHLFWQRAGEKEGFPRTLDRALIRAFPVAIVKLPHLQLRDIEDWLKRRNTLFTFACESRAMRGCLVAYGGRGVIFLDGTDPEEELRISLAHEIAHFLLDYWIPRQKAILGIGDQIKDVLDGVRSPTVHERVIALIQGVHLGIHTNLLDRGSNADDLYHTWAIEDNADKFAMNLLAPPEDVLHRTDLSAPTFDERNKTIQDVLQADFGLPSGIASIYGIKLLSIWGKGPKWVETLHIK